MTPPLFRYDYICCVNFHRQVLFKYQKVCYESVFKELRGQVLAILWVPSSRTDCSEGQRFPLNMVSFGLEVAVDATAKRS